MGGRIQSHSGKGTSVELWLPLAHGEVWALIAPAAIQAAESDTKSLVIVVVDDDKLVLTNTTAMLEDFGHRVIEANSGAAALDLNRKTAHLDRSRDYRPSHAANDWHAACRGNQG